jgi:hypothetical protein
MSNYVNTITPEAVQKFEGGDERKFPKRNNGFDEKNYLNVRLADGENKREIRIRILPISNVSNSPFEHIFMHSTKVPREVSKSGFKSYICLNRSNGAFSEKYGNRCPFCERRNELYKQADNAKEAGNIELSNQLREEAKTLYPNEVSIIRCIERGHEEDGPKFWKFNLRSDKKDPESQMLKIYQDRMEECQEEGIPVENVFDSNRGYDFKISIERQYDKMGKPTNKTIISVSRFGSLKPISQDPNQMNAWINDDKKWTDVFSAKSYEYLSIILNKQIPWFDKNQGIWVPKQNTESTYRQAENEERRFNSTQGQQPQYCPQAQPQNMDGPQGYYGGAQPASFGNQPQRF